MPLLSTCFEQFPKRDNSTPQTSCVKQAPGFAWNHGDFQQQITNTCFAMVGPGVNVAGVDNATFSDHTDVRPTMFTLLGLKDDYPHEGRALVEEFSDYAQPSAVKKSANFVALAQALKQINAAVGPFGVATLQASTFALNSGTANDDSPISLSKISWPLMGPSAMRWGRKANRYSRLPSSTAQRFRTLRHKT